MSEHEDQRILAANARFYEAFATRDLEAMDALWARTLPVACNHPGWSMLKGRARVLASFRGILGSEDSPKIVPTEATCFVYGEVAFVLCYENVPRGRLLATNVFAREQGEWRMVHHQAGPTTPRQDEPEPESAPDRSKLN